MDFFILTVCFVFVVLMFKNFLYTTIENEDNFTIIFNSVCLGLFSILTTVLLFPFIVVFIPILFLGLFVTGNFRTFWIQFWRF